MCFFFAAVPREVADGTYNNMAALFRLSSFDSDVFKQKKKRKKRKQNEAPNPCMCHQITELAILEKKIRIKDKHKTRRQKRKKKITVKCRTGNRYPICHRPNDDTKKAAGFLFFLRASGNYFYMYFYIFVFFLLLLLLLFQFRIWNQLALRVILLPIFITHCFCCSSSIGCTSVMLTRLSYTLIYIHLSVLAVGVKRDQLREGERNITYRILLDMKTSPDPGAHIPMIQMQSDRSG